MHARSSMSGWQSRVHSSEKATEIDQNEADGVG